MKISIIIPLHNEAKHIGKVLDDVLKYNLPVIVVDDGSVDESGKLIKKSNVVVLSHKINLGKGSAMKTGSEYAFNNGYDAVIFMDADGQHNPKNIVDFVNMLKSGKYDVVLGSRILGKDVPTVRRYGNVVAAFIVRLLFGVSTSDPICGFRGMTRSGYKKIMWDSTGYGVETEMIARMGKNMVKFIEVPVDTIYHDKDKGVTILNAIGILVDILKLRLLG